MTKRYKIRLDAFQLTGT